MNDETSAIPDDDLSRALTVARPDRDDTLIHVGLVGDTYTILVSGEDTAGAYGQLQAVLRVATQALTGQAPTVMRRGHPFRRRCTCMRDLWRWPTDVPVP